MIVRLVALLDVVIAIGLAGAIVVGGMNIPILVPILLAFCALGILAVSFIL